MKTLGLCLATFLICASALPQEPIVVEPTADGNGVKAGLDLAAVADPPQGGILAHLKRNWGKYLAAAGAAYAADRVAEKNGWLWHDSGSGDRTQTITDSGDRPSEILSVEVRDSENIKINIEYKDSARTEAAK